MAIDLDIDRTCIHLWRGDCKVWGIDLGVHGCGCLPDHDGRHMCPCGASDEAVERAER